MKELNIAVGGMKCELCRTYVEQALVKTDGVSSAKVDLTAGIAKIAYDEEKCGEDELCNAVITAGFSARIISEKAPSEISDNAAMPRSSLIIILVLAAAEIYISMGHMLALPLPDFIAPDSSPLAFALVLMFIALIIVGASARVYSNGLGRLLRLNPNFNSLIAVGTLPAILFNLYSTARIYYGDADAIHGLYYESAATVLALTALGKSLEARNGNTGNHALTEIADKVAGLFVPFIMLIALVSGAGWLAMAGKPELAVNAFVSVLIVSCPCALGFAAPTAILTGTARAAMSGILFQNSAALERLSEAKIFFLDKADTLTSSELRFGKNESPDALDGAVWGLINIREEVRESSVKAVEMLREMGCRVLMLTGGSQDDNVENAVIASMEEKAHEYVPADITITAEGIGGVVQAVDICRRTTRIIRQNIFWAFFYNALCIPLAAGGLFLLFGSQITPIPAGAATVLSSVTVVTNSLRCLKIKKVVFSSNFPKQQNNS